MDSKYEEEDEDAKEDDETEEDESDAVVAVTNEEEGEDENVESEQAQINATMPIVLHQHDSTGELAFGNEKHSEESDDEENASGTTSSDDIIKYINDPTLLDELDHNVRLMVEVEIEAYKADQAELRKFRDNWRKQMKLLN